MATPNRKAFVEIQFNWVFVLIVGAIILIFFVSIVNSQKKNSDKTLAFDVLSKIDLIMSGGLTVPKTGQLFDMPNLEFGFDCNSLSVFGVTRQFPEKIVFGPDRLKGIKLVVWSQDWNVPFKATNFLYITTSDVRYIFVDSTAGETSALLFNSTPNMTKDRVTNIMNLNNDKNNYKIRVVYFFSDPGTLPPFIANMNDADVTAVSIKDKYVKFYVKQGSNFVAQTPDIKYYFLGDPAIFGAIFSENGEMYKCSMEKAFTNLHYIAKIYAAREEEIATDSRYADSICKGLRANGPTGAMEFIAGATADITGIVTAPTIIYGSDGISGIFGKMSNLELANQKNLENSCPSIY